MERLERVKANAMAIREIVQRHSAANPRVFGSTARGEDGADSDIDILVDMQPMMSIFDLLHIQDDLQSLLGGDIDVVVDSNIPDGARDAIMREAIAL